MIALERTDLSTVSTLRESDGSWKNWFLTVSTLGWCDGLGRTDF